MAAALGGVDAVAFTGGVGEHDAELRARVVAGLGFLGVGVDERRNRAAGAARGGPGAREAGRSAGDAGDGPDGSEGDADVSSAGASAAVLVIRAREDLEIARQVREVLGG